MIDFTKCKTFPCTYGGSEKKKKILYNGEIYLLKFPDPIREKGNPLSYMNNVFSEYIGCKIFESCGILVQDVLIGTYNELNKIKNVVACKDFTTKDLELIEFSSLSNSITNLDRHFTTDIQDVYDIFENLDYKYDKKELIDNFWNMFVVDTLIGNTDRHLSNFGYLSDGNKLKIAPVYDCGSSLNPLISDDDMLKALTDDSLFKDYSYNLCPIYKYKGKRLTFQQFYNNNIEDLNNALLRIYPKINMNVINSLIDDISTISDARKTFLKKSILYRKTHILDKKYKKLTQ